MATFSDHSVAASRPRPVAAADRITRPVMNVLCASLAAVYLFSALTMPAGHVAVVTGEAAIAAVQVVWLLAANLLPRRAGGVYVAGIVLQLALTVLWIVTRTVGLPGIGRLPVGLFDLLCAVDALVIAALCWRCAPLARPLTPRMRLGFCQVAVILAASTAYMSMDSMMAMTGSGAGHGSAGVSAVGGHASEHLFCHLL